MKFPEQTSLFRYRGWHANERFRSEVALIGNQKVWCTLAESETFNDPFDCRVPVRRELSKEEARDILDQIGKEYQHPRKKRRAALARTDIDFVAEVGAFVDNAQTVINRIPICCFSSDPSDFVLWSHYANAHRGMCVEYSRSPENGLGDYRDTRKVGYAKEVRWNITDIIELGNMGEEAVTGSQLFNDTLFCKTEAWEYEQEYRYAGGIVEGENRSPGEILSVTFGLKMNAADRDYVNTTLGDRIKYWEMKQIKDTFEIKRHPI